ncbi:hypothetical protein [Flavobacterium sp.]|uniref:hypothetical protein n=1 Tax=Flavobacterium sp. TaxID=239 RepID=UPI001209683B|nr:hypothetical protein [Flavobacterium sp.]RZJ68962.1 MAG: hypothetical protein EOO49_19035 [Flavobacterium sp.]
MKNNKIILFFSKNVLNSGFFSGAFSGWQALAFLQKPVFLEVVASFLRSLLQPKKNAVFSAKG